MAGGVFRRRVHRVPPRRVVHGVAGVVVVQAPGLHRYRHPALHVSALRVRHRVRQVRVYPLLGIRQPGAPLVNFAEEALKFWQKIQKERLARMVMKLYVSIEPPVVVGEAPSAQRPGVRRLEALARHAPARVVAGAALIEVPKQRPRQQLPQRVALLALLPPRIVVATGVRQPGKIPPRPLRRAFLPLVPQGVEKHRAPVVSLIGVRQPGMIPASPMARVFVDVIRPPHQPRALAAGFAAVIVPPPPSRRLTRISVELPRVVLPPQVIVPTGVRPQIIVPPPPPLRAKVFAKVRKLARRPRVLVSSIAAAPQPGIVSPQRLAAIALVTARVFLARPRLVMVPGGVAQVVTVCTGGVWSSTISFVVCDDYRVQIDGPATDNVRISATLEFEDD